MISCQSDKIWLSYTLFLFLFSPKGDLLASVGGDPDYMLTIWDWKEEQTVLRSKAFSQEVFRVTFSTELEGQLTTAGTGHIRYCQVSRPGCHIWKELVVSHVSWDRNINYNEDNFQCQCILSEVPDISDQCVQAGAKHFPKIANPFQKGWGKILNWQTNFEYNFSIKICYGSCCTKLEK